MSIGERIKELRTKKGLSQDELAKRLGYKSKSTINKIEKGINDISQTNIYKFAQVLGTTPAYLMGWEEDVEQLATQTYWNIKLNEIIMDFNDEQMEKLCDYAELLALKK